MPEKYWFWPAQGRKNKGCRDKVLQMVDKGVEREVIAAECGVGVEWVRQILVEDRKKKVTLPEGLSWAQYVARMTPNAVAAFTRRHKTRAAHDEGCSYAEIARAMGISVTRVWQMVKQAEKEMI